MSEERVDVIRRTWERWNSGEREINASDAHPDIVIRSAMTNAEYHGYDGWRSWIAEIDDQFGDWHLSIDQIQDASEDQILVLGTVHVRGRTSGVEFDQPMGWLLRFAGERVIELQNIPDHAQALEAAGLSE
jgi:ketosteroid isomerase-like protein